MEEVGQASKSEKLEMLLVYYNFAYHFTYHFAYHFEKKQ